MRKAPTPPPDADKKAATPPDAEKKAAKKSAKKAANKPAKKTAKQAAKKRAKKPAKKSAKQAAKKPAKKATKKATEQAGRPRGKAGKPPKRVAKAAGTDTTAREPVPAQEPQPPDAPAPVDMPDPATVDRPWLASYPPAVPETYSYPLVPLTRLLDDAAQDFPQVPAVEFLGYSLTYREVLDRVDRLAAALGKLGVQPGDRVGVILPNCPQHVIAIFAILRVGAVVVETNPLYTEEELAHQINDAGCKVLICLDPVYRKLANLKGRLQTVEHILATGIQDVLPFPRNLLFPLTGRRDDTYYKIPDSEGVHRLADLIRRTGPTAAQAPIDPQEDVAVLLYTGGTGGVSKGVMLTHFNLVANAFQARLWMPDVQAGRENVLTVMPLFHAYGFTTCLTVGVLSAATLTLLPRFDRDQTLRTIDRRKPTLFPGVPTIYVALGNAPNVRKHDLSSIRACLSGAAPLPAEVARRFETLTGGKLREGYGLTETAPITHANPIYGKAKEGSIGLPVSDTVCTLRDVEDPSKPAAPGEPGELAVAGPQVMKGYWNRPEETAAVLQDGWLLTGDIAAMDEEGYFAIVDRKRDVIIAGDSTIYPRDVEAVLHAHPKVSRAVVTGVPDPQRGEAIKAYVVLEDGESSSAEELGAFLRERLAEDQLPTAYAFRDSLPETVAGKVLRRILAEEEAAADEG